MKPKPLSAYLTGFMQMPLKVRSETGNSFAIDFYRLYERYPPKRFGLNAYSYEEVRMILALRSLDRIFGTRIQVLTQENKHD